MLTYKQLLKKLGYSKKLVKLRIKIGKKDTAKLLTKFHRLLNGENITEHINKDILSKYKVKYKAIK